MAWPPVFDGHNDALTRADHELFATGRDGGHVDLPRMGTGGMRGGIFSLFTPSRRERKRPLPRTDAVIEFELAPAVSHQRAAADASAAAARLIGLERAGLVRIGRRIEDFDGAFAGDGSPVAVMHLEGAEAIDPALEALEFWHAAGLRSLGPVWSRPNAFGHGVPFVFPSSPNIGPGLTDAGRALVARCAELGIMVDVSHLNEAGFWDVARIGRGPLVASHSGAHGVAAASRNLKDAQLTAIAESDGLVGVIFGCSFIRGDFREDPDTPLELIAAHAGYIADRIGVNHVALGSDFDGTVIPAAVGDAAGLPRVLAALSAAGFSAAELESIAWKNWRRVLAAWWDV